MYQLSWVITALDIIPAAFTIIGNAIFFITLWKTTSLHTPSNVLLGFLSITDLMVGLICQPAFIIILFHEDRPCCTTVMHVYNVVFFLTSWNSYLCIALITLDRAFAILHPFKYCEVASCKRFSIVAALMFIISSLYVILEQSFYTKSKIDFLLVQIILQLLVLCLISITYVLIYRAIRHQNKTVVILKDSSGRKLRQLSRNEHGRTKTVVLILFGFTVCTVPHIVNDLIMYLFYTDKIKYISGFAHWANFLFLFNSAINPLIYFMSRTDIRSATRRLLCRSNANSFRTQRAELKKGNSTKYARKYTVNFNRIGGEIAVIEDSNIDHCFGNSAVIT